MSAIEFSIDRPFGIYLWDYFDKAYTAVMGSSANDFHFVEGETPFSTIPEVAVGVFTYLMVIFGGRYILREASATHPKFIFQIHNLLLTLVSLAILLLLIEQLVPQLYNHGLYWTICSYDAWTQKHELLYYLNYLVKYWELADTVFLVLKKKKLEFLHVFHHSMTMVLCFTQLVGRTTVSWVPIVLNLTVHVFMYYYYFRTASGAKIWWKRYLTTMQITQFIIDLFAVYGCTYTFYASKYAPHLPNFGTCSGGEGAAWFGCAILSSYLVLFINFYRMTYKSGSKKAATAATKAPIANGVSKKSKKI
ncbi:GNS1/SUR4 family-domain-containing protein [Phascolomyces articulosus]|uniref:Elongation of fatty acids protein n=1 Tax=Phascolomyces articulosus TaxID=60185 RepID=A0AAD5JWV3_9FUNG|nr:GNS1/SUR4 family-domain-containing protein [Phascolomyces articulosus]